MNVAKKKWRMLYREQIKLQTCYCYLCGKAIDKEKELSLEHRTPLSRGGKNEPSNWSPAHKKCNSDKGALTYEEWLLFQELLKKKNGNVR